MKLVQSGLELFVISLTYYYRKFWHQYLRQPFTSISNFAVRDVFRLPRSSILERYTNIFFVFLISGILHVIVDILQGLPAHRSGAMPFFLSFVLGIMLEDGAQAIWWHLFTSGDRKTPRKSSTREAVVPPLWQRILGLCWVWAWLAVTSTWYFTPMIQLTTKDSVMIPFSFAERMGLPVISSALLASGAVLAFAFEIEI
ncbi:hypothetical protein NUU61_000666 [Penicillium alfredii]|uniref:Wax synthase domain-containing protein n=1 Tax=Penicillium alfredii TaxID=1506179 RepID=A0A9W9GB75_9EURO|nr:uncharacterized protein NUU61_000666 [Penicillium alfredii]KAJ5114907.1 hypothetical protein NUU61_000666 [Penicillium alfredii]